MRDVRASRANFDGVLGTQGHPELEAKFSFAETRGFAPAPLSGVRMDRVCALRTAIENGHYFVRSGDLARKMLSTMREGPALRSRKTVEHSLPFDLAKSGCDLSASSGV